MDKPTRGNVFAVVRRTKHQEWRLGVTVLPWLWSLYRKGWIVSFAFGRRDLAFGLYLPEPAYRSLVAESQDVRP